MADETTQTDTATSEASTETTALTDGALVEQTAEQQTATDAEATATADTAKTEGDDDGTALTGDLKAEVKESEGAPEAYDLKLEDGELDTELVAEAEPILRELNLSNDQANTLMPIAQKLVAKSQDATVKALTDAAAQQRADWLAIAKSDEEIGGPKWNDTLALSAKGMDYLGFAEGHPFRDALKETGFGNNRDMISVFRRVGELVGEDGFARGGASEATANVPIWDRIYSTDKK